MRTFNRNIPLDSYRGLLAILVASGHYFYWLGDSDGFPISFILAVDFFFILSGFVLTYPILLNTKDSLSSFFFQFIRSRFFRLFPLYLFLVIPLSLAIAIISNSYPSLLDWVKIFFLLNIFPIESNSGFNIPLGIAWSISAEFWIGILFFPIVFSIRKNKFLHFFLILVIVTSLFTLIKYSPQFMDVHDHKLNLFMTFSMPRSLLGFSIGGIVAYALFCYPSAGNYLLQSTLQFVCLTIIMVSYFALDYNRNNEYYAPFIFGIFIFSIATEKGIFYSVFNNQFSHYLGKISFSVYLSHPVFIGLIKQEYLTKNFLVYILITLVFSTFCYYVIEKPFIRYGKKGKIFNER